MKQGETRDNSHLFLFSILIRSSISTSLHPVYRLFPRQTTPNSPRSQPRRQPHLRILSFTHPPISLAHFDIHSPTHPLPPQPLPREMTPVYLMGPPPDLILSSRSKAETPGGTHLAAKRNPPGGTHPPILSSAHPLPPLRPPLHASRFTFYVSRLPQEGDTSHKINLTSNAIYGTMYIKLIEAK